MAVIKTDTFTVDSPDITLDNHTSDTGGGWQGSQDAAFTALAATDDVQRGSGIAAVIGDETNTEVDYFVEIIGTLGGTASNDRIGCVIRAEDGATFSASGSNYYQFRMEGASGWYLYRYEGLSGQQNDGFSSPSPPADASWLADSPSVGTTDPIKMKITITGISTVSIKLELDVDTGGGFGGYETVWEGTDSDSNAISTSGGGGIYMRDGNARITYFNSEDFTSSGNPWNYYVQMQ